MISFVGQVLHDVGAPAVAILATATVTGAIGAMLRDIALGLRAKRRARHYMQQAMMREAAFRELVAKAYAASFEAHAAEMDALRRSVETHLETMSDTDKRLVGQGLHQRSLAGSERYLRELVDPHPLREVA